MSELTGKQKDKLYNKIGMTPDKMLVGMELIAGAKAKQVGQRLGKTARTMRRWRNDFRNYIMQSQEFKDAPDRMKAMITNALDVYDKYLKGQFFAQGAPDLQAATNILKYTGLFIDRQEVDHLHAESTNEELKEDLRELLGEDVDIDTGDGDTGEGDSSGAETPQDAGADTGVHPDGAAEQ